MKRLVIAALAAGLAPQGCSCGNDSANEPDAGIDAPSFDQCDADPPAFVRHAFLALDGHRPRSQAEVDVYADLYTQAEELGDDPRETVARAIMARPEFAERWIDVVMDALQVQRTDIQSESSCWGQEMRTTVSPALATAVRDQSATQAGDGGGTWTMLDLARSAIALDDLTPLYRAQLFSMVSHPIPAANVPAVEAELARRADFGATFGASYLHRDVVCLGCHTSETSITDNEEPALDRHWPVPGAPERAVYGSPMGFVGDDVHKAHTAFRVDQFVDEGNARPWGWSSACGRFASPSQVGDDIAGVDGKLGSVTGTRTTVYTLEQALARGFSMLRGTGVAADQTLTDPDAALAWLVTLKMTEDVWRAATGTSLTIANYYPRNEAARNLLYDLANRYAQSGYSLQALLVAIVASDYFARLAPDAGCGTGPYTYPNVFDPWVPSDADEERRLNGPGDAVTAIDARTLVNAVSIALDWPVQPGGNRFPDFGEGCVNTQTCQALNSNCQSFQACCDTYQIVCTMGGVLPSVEVPFQQSVGTFLRNSERGFRGLDFQARLAWEERYGACTRPAWVGNDFIDLLVARGATNAAVATVGDVIRALKDRLINEPEIDGGAETDALVAIVGPLEAPANTLTVDAARRVCGALVMSPQFLLQGIAGRGGERPLLTPGDLDYQPVCAELAARGVPGRTITCDPTLTLQ